MNKHTVKNKDTRPILKDKITCGYCNSKIGEEHEKKCVCRRKDININLIINMTIDVPEFWTKEDIEFWANKGTYCSSNFIDDIKKLNKKGDDCICQHTTLEYLNDIGENNE